MLLCALKRGCAFLIAGGLLWAWAVRAEPPDPLGAADRYYPAGPYSFDVEKVE
jgi:hypothetical protein